METKTMALVILAMLSVGIAVYGYYYGEQQKAAGYQAGLSAVKPSAPVVIPSVDISTSTNQFNFSTEVTSTGTISDGDATSGELLTKTMDVEILNKGSTDASGLTLGVANLDKDLEIDEASTYFVDGGVKTYLVKDGDVRSPMTVPTLVEDASYSGTLTEQLEETNVQNTLPDGATLKFDLTVYYNGQKVDDATISVLT